MEAKRDAKEAAPEEHAHSVLPAACPPAEGKEQDAAGADGKPVVLAEPDVEAVAGEVGDVAGKNGGLCVERLAPDEPSGMGPPAAFARGVGVAVVVAELMVNAVRGHPEDGAALERERGAERHEVLKPLGDLVATVREQAVVAHANADVNGQNVKNDHRGQTPPAEEEKRSKRTDVEDCDDPECEPVDAVACGGGTTHAHKLASGNSVGYRGCRQSGG